MPPRVRRTSSRRISSARRSTTWATVDATFSIPAAGGFQTQDLLANFKADGGTQQAVTVVRTHLRLIPTSAVATQNSFHFGLIRGQMSDVGTNIAGAPTPAASPYEDWLLWDLLVYDQTSSLDQFSGTQLHYDLRSMRKLSELQMNYNAVIDVPAAAAFPFVARLCGRILLKLP